METTEIAPARTVGDISALLVQAGAREIATQYENGAITGLKFAMDIAGNTVHFAMPVRSEPIYKILVKRSRSTWLGDAEKRKKREQAERVAWRQLLRWIQAQLAMIDTGMVVAHEVFLPYLLHPGTQQTLFEYFNSDGMKQLTAGSASAKACDPK